MKHIAVVGAGVAGLAVSARLAAKGYRVTVFEQNDFIGGKCSTINMGDFKFDRGPSLFTKPEYLNEVFESCGERMEDFFEFALYPKHCKYSWSDGTMLEGKSEDFASNIKKVFGVELDIFLARNSDKFRNTEEIFLNRSLHRLKSYLFRGIAKSLLYMPRLNVFQNLHQYHEKNLKSPKLVQLFDRFATYNGSNPYQASAVLSLISSLEIDDGVYFPTKGMGSITNSLYNLGIEKGVEYRFSEKVEKINLGNSKVQSIDTQKGKYVFDDLVWSNDVKFCYDLLGEAKPKLQNNLSSSGGVFYWGLAKEYPQVDLHNIIFSNNYREEFNKLFGNDFSNDLTVYIHKASSVVEGMAPKGKEGWFVMVNLPPRLISDDEINKIRGFVQSRISKYLGEDISKQIICEEKMFPQDIERITGAFAGALYGQNSNFWHSSLTRHSNFHKSLKNLKFCGGTVHPGGGVPLSLKSAKIVADSYEALA